MKTPTPSIQQRGYGIVEILLGLAIASALIAAAVVFFSGASSRNQTNNAIQTVNTIAANLKNDFGAFNRYASISTEVAVTSRDIPDNLHDSSGTTATNVFGGAITVAPATLITTGDATDMSWANVPSQVCFDLALGTDQSARRMLVGNTTVKPTDGTLNVATLSTACKASDRVAITWSYGRT